MKVLYVQYCVNFRSFFYWHFHSGSDLLTLSHTGVSIKIEVVSRFKSSNRQYQQGAVSLLLLGGERASGYIVPQKILTFQSPIKKCDFQLSGN